MMTGTKWAWLKSQLVLFNDNLEMTSFNNHTIYKIFLVDLFKIFRT